MNFPIDKYYDNEVKIIIVVVMMALTGMFSGLILRSTVYVSDQCVRRERLQTCLVDTKNYVDACINFADDSRKWIGQISEGCK